MKSANLLDPIENSLDQSVFKGEELKRGVQNFIETKIAALVKDQFGFEAETLLHCFLTGSLTTYQYSKTSDFDLNIFPDYQNWPGYPTDAEELRAQLVIMFTHKLDGIFIPGTQHPIQTFVFPEDTHPEDNFKTGVQAAWDFQTRSWFIPPFPPLVDSVEEQLPAMLQRAYRLGDKMDTLLNTNPQAAIKLYNKIHQKRKTDIKRYGPVSEGNILYKYLDRLGMFARLRNLGVRIAKTADLKDYEHWNEDQHYMWWMEEGRFENEPREPDYDDYDREYEDVVEPAFYEDQEVIFPDSKGFPQKGIITEAIWNEDRYKTMVYTDENGYRSVDGDPYDYYVRRNGAEEAELVNGEEISPYRSEADYEQAVDWFWKNHISWQRLEQGQGYNSVPNQGEQGYMKFPPGAGTQGIKYTPFYNPPKKSSPAWINDYGEIGGYDEEEKPEGEWEWTDEEFPEDWDGWIGWDRHRGWGASLDGKGIVDGLSERVYAIRALEAAMNRSGYFPNCWEDIDNRGYPQLLDMKKELEEDQPNFSVGSKVIQFYTDNDGELSTIIKVERDKDTFDWLYTFRVDDDPSNEHAGEEDILSDTSWDEDFEAATPQRIAEWRSQKYENMTGDDPNTGQRFLAPVNDWNYQNPPKINPNPKEGSVTDLPQEGTIIFPDGRVVHWRDADFEEGGFFVAGDDGNNYMIDMYPQKKSWKFDQGEYVPVENPEEYEVEVEVEYTPENGGWESIPGAYSPEIQAWTKAIDQDQMYNEEIMTQHQYDEFPGQMGLLSLDPRYWGEIDEEGPVWNPPTINPKNSSDPSVAALHDPGEIDYVMATTEEEQAAPLAIPAPQPVAPVAKTKTADGGGVQDSVPWQFKEELFAYKFLKVKEDGTLYSPVQRTEWPVGQSLIADAYNPNLSADQVRGQGGIHCVPEGEWNELYSSTYGYGDPESVLVKLRVYAYRPPGHTGEPYQPIHGKKGVLLAPKAKPIAVIGTDKELLLKVANKYAIDIEYVGEGTKEEPGNVIFSVPDPYEDGEWTIEDANPEGKGTGSGKYKGFEFGRDIGRGYSRDPSKMLIVRNPEGKEKAWIKFGDYEDGRVDGINVEDSGADEVIYEFMQSLEKSGRTPYWNKRAEQSHFMEDYEYAWSNYRDKFVIDNRKTLLQAWENISDYAFDENNSYEWDESDTEHEISDQTDNYGVHYWDSVVFEPLPPKLIFDAQTWQAMFGKELEWLLQGEYSANDEDVAVALVQVPLFMEEDQAQNTPTPAERSKDSPPTEGEQLGFPNAKEFIRQQIAQLPRYSDENVERFIQVMESALGASGAPVQENQQSLFDTQWNQNDQGSWTQQDIPWNENDQGQLGLPGAFGKASNLIEVTQVLYDLNTDTIILGEYTKESSEDDHIHLLGEYDGENVIFFPEHGQWFSPDYFKKLWAYSHVDKPLKDIFMLNDGEVMKLETKPYRRRRTLKSNKEGIQPQVWDFSKSFPPNDPYFGTDGYYPDSGEVYNITQTHDEIHDGDVLVIPQEGVVGIMVSAWPTAITETGGNFHTLNPGTIRDMPGQGQLLEDQQGLWETYDGGKYLNSYRIAVQEANKLGLKVAAKDDEPNPNQLGLDPHPDAGTNARLEFNPEYKNGPWMYDSEWDGLRPGDKATLVDWGSGGWLVDPDLTYIEPLLYDNEADMRRYWTYLDNRMLDVPVNLYLVDYDDDYYNQTEDDEQWLNPTGKIASSEGLGSMLARIDAALLYLSAKQEIVPEAREWIHEVYNKLKDDPEFADSFDRAQEFFKTPYGQERLKPLINHMPPTPDGETQLEHDIHYVQSQMQQLEDEPKMMAKVAVWRDVEMKAKRYLDSGAVDIENNLYNYINGTVHGDNGDYETQIWRDDPSSRAITTWNCFKAGTPVTLANGTRKAIEEIEEGEEVITHLGNIRPVTAIYKRPYQGKMIRVKLAGIEEEIIATEDHPLWTADRNFFLEDKHPKTRWEYTGSTATLTSNVLWKEIRNLIPGDYLSMTPPKEEIEIDEIDEEIATLLGWFIAEGFSVKNTNRIGFSLNRTEEAIAKQLSEICQRKFGTPGTIRLLDSTIDFRVSNADLKSLLLKLVGTGAKTKSLDRSLFYLPRDLQRIIINTWVEGDGHFDKQGNRLCITSANGLLMHQARILLARLGYDSEFIVQENNVSALVPGGTTLYKIRWNEQKKQSYNN